jgi:hypothetical protein
MAPLLAKPSPLNINLGSDRFSMFNKKAGHRQARVASGRTRPLHARMDLRDAPGSGSACAVAEQRSENLLQRQPSEAGKKAAPAARVLQSAFRAGHYIAVTAFVVMIFMVVG